MTCEQAKNELLEAKALFCDKPLIIKGIILSKIKIKLNILMCCDEEEGGATTTTTTTTTIKPPRTTTTSEEVPIGLKMVFTDIEAMPGGLTAGSSVGDWNTFFNLPTNGNEFGAVYVTGNTVILYNQPVPDNIVIEPALFKNSNLRELSDQGGIVIGVGAEAFMGCGFVFSFSLPIMTGADDDAFNGCSAVNTFSFPSLATIGDRCFLDCVSTITFNLPSLSAVGDRSFENCTSATSMTFSSFLSSAGISCFRNCSSMLVFDMPNLVVAGAQCFENCSSATFILPSMTTAGFYCFKGCSSATAFSFPALTFAGVEFFYGCTSAISFQLPLVTSVYDACFENCTSTTSIYMPLCTNLGSPPGATGDDGVFAGITGQMITVTVAANLATINGGNPDGDLQYLAANNTATIVYI